MGRPVRPKMLRGLGLAAGAAMASALLAAAPAAAPPAGPVWVPASMDQVLVFSTQARVFRAANVPLTGAGPKDVALADLPDAVIPDTVRVEAKSAEVVRVTVIRTRGQLPRQLEAKELLAKIEGIKDKLTDLRNERTVLQGEQSFVRTLSLRREPSARRARPPAEGLFSDAWRKTLVWMEARSIKISARMQAIAAAQRKLNKALHALRVKAAEIDPASGNRLVSRVVATLRGRPGRHRVVLSYRVAGVRWVPSYDLRYVAGQRRVEATYYAVVNQNTGEDWNKAKLRFSTSTPTQLLAIPELPTWTLGRKRDFTPVPRERVERAPRPWVAPAPPVVRDPVLEQLRQALRPGRNRVELDGKLAPGRHRVTTRSPAYKAKVGYRKRTTFNFSADTIDGGLVRPGAAKKVAPSRPMPVQAPRAEPPPAPPTEAMAESAMDAPALGASGGGRRSYQRSVSRASRVQQETVPWTDVGYRPPSLHRDLPAAAAKGYRFTLYAPGRHSVQASGKRQRVPLIRERLKVKPIYRILPGLSKKAYLMAEVKNTTGRPILRGNANLFTGAMFSGRSWINTALPGKTIKLPLGVDDSIKVERHLRQKTVVKGTFFKDDITEYTIQIEIANHHRYSVNVELEDQVPVKLGRKIEVKGFSAKPSMKKPDDKGKIRWEGTIKGRAVKKLAITFQIVRPKDWEVRQHDG
jgi:hypothetical protein